MEWIIEDELGSRILQFPNEIALSVNKILEGDENYCFVVLKPSEPVNEVNFIQVGLSDNLLLEISKCMGRDKTHLYSHEFDTDDIINIMTSFYRFGSVPDLRGWTFEGEFCR